MHTSSYDCLVSLAQRYKLKTTFGDFSNVDNKVVTAYMLNIRAEPSTSAKVVGTLYQGDVVTVIGSTSLWSKIGEGRWVYSQYLKVIN